jgi:hypothetical protein
MHDAVKIIVPPTTAWCMDRGNWCRKARWYRTGNLKICAKIGHKARRCWNLASSKKVSLCGRRIGGAYLIENMDSSDDHRRTHFRTPAEPPKTSLV